MNVHNAIQGTVTTTDTSLLDTIQAALPSEDSPRVGAEYTEHREPVEDSDAKRLVGRLTFADTLQGKAMAEYVFAEVAGHDLAARADDWSLRLYRTPEGGVTQDEVEEWYEANPGEQPTDEDGEAFIPQSWDPRRHTITEVEG